MIECLITKTNSYMIDLFMVDFITKLDDVELVYGRMGIILIY
jgi:hypothetical protein